MLAGLHAKLRAANVVLGPEPHVFHYLEHMRVHLVVPGGPELVHFDVIHIHARRRDSMPALS